MTRRDFLKFSIGLPALSSLPEFASALAATRHHVRFNLLWGARLIGVSEENEAAAMSIFRGEFIVLEFAINARGGALFWVPTPGAEIVWTSDCKVVVTGPAIASLAIDRTEHRYSPFGPVGTPRPFVREVLK